MMIRSLQIFFNKEYKSKYFINSYNKKTNLVKNKLLKKLCNNKLTKQGLSKHLINNYTLVKITKDKLFLKNFNKEELIINYKKCILCCGGLEYARILLNNNFNNKNIGKYYSPHLNIIHGKCILNKNIYLKNNNYIKNNIS